MKQKEEYTSLSKKFGMDTELILLILNQDIKHGLNEIHPLVPQDIRFFNTHSKKIPSHKLQFLINGLTRLNPGSIIDPLIHQLYINEVFENEEKKKQEVRQIRQIFPR